MSINPLYWLSPVKFGIKSTCDGTYRRSCRSRRVLVIPPLTFDRYVQVSQSNRNSSHENTVCACVCVCDSVCARVCVWWASGLETARASAVLYPFVSADGGCFLWNDASTQRWHGEHYFRSRKAGRATCLLYAHQHLEDAAAATML